MIHWIHTMVWGPGMLVLFLAVGILYTLRLRGFVFWGFPRWWKNTAGSLWKTPEKTGTNEENIQGGDAAGGMSPFQSACTALAATIGTGNIAGVATALLSGGPGAIFWMWVSAFLGMATAYGETVLGIRYRKRDRSGGWVAGPMLYMERGLGGRWAGLLYAGLCAAASFGMGSMVQANAISETLEFSFSMPPVLIGGLLVLLSGRIMAGGAGAIAGAAEKMVPVSAGIYMAASAAVLFLFRENIPSAFGMIFQDAFSFRSAAGGAVGLLASKSVQYGIARGVFSNEAGLGSLAVLNGAAEGDPGVQGQWAIFEVFFDTVVSCTLTAVVILCAMGGELPAFSGNGAELTGICFSRGLGNLGGYTVSMCVALFAFATIIAWYYMGRQAASYLGEAVGKDLVRIYTAGYLAAVFLGSLGPMELVWEVSDVLNGCMAVPNLAALVLLSGKVGPPERAGKEL